MKKKTDVNTEEKIMAAARKVLFEKGYDGARMQDIANEAQINKALLHYYFRSKEKLFEMIFREAVGKLIPAISTIFSNGQMRFEDKIRAFCSTYIRTWIEHPYIPMFVLREVHSGSGRFLKLIKDVKVQSVKDVLASIETAVKKKEIKPIDPHQLLLNMISLCMFPFLGAPVFKAVTGVSNTKFGELVERRVDEVAEFIIESIKYRK